MTEKETIRRYYEAYAELDSAPSYYNAKQVHRWASALVDISDDYTAQYDEACDILSDTIG